MAETCSWGSIPSSGNGEMSDFLRLQSGNSYKIRPVFDPVSFFKFFHKSGGKLRTAIIDKNEIAMFCDKHPEVKKPSLRYAAYVIDRADDKVKILEAPQTVFRPIGSSLEMTGKDPGSGNDGSDWYIKVSGTGLTTKYDVGMIGPSPLTKEERTLIKEALKGDDGEFDKQKLHKLYNVDTLAEIENKLFGESDSGQPSRSQTAVSSPVEAPAGAAGGEDFDQEW